MAADAPAPRRLEGRVAVVAGAGTAGGGMGNGKAAALAYARAGAKVVAADIDRAAAEETRHAIEREGGTCTSFAGDLSDDTVACGLVAAAQSAYVGIDILHHNIGIFLSGGPEGVEEADWDQLFRVNLKSLYLCSKHTLPQMAARGAGVVTTVGSISGRIFMGLPQIAYATSKAAVEAFTRALAAEYGPKGIRANTIVAGVIETPLLSRAYSGAAGRNARRARMAAIPLGRFGSPADLASAAVFLASDEARYITGASLVVDGGLLCLAAGASGS